MRARAQLKPAAVRRPGGLIYSALRKTVPKAAGTKPHGLISLIPDIRPMLGSTGLMIYSSAFPVWDIWGG